MRAVETLIVGAGQAGLAVSRCLTAQGADHVVVERGRIAERWRSARWDSLRLLTPNWMSRLPAWSYPGPDPDGYMAAPELAGYLEDYASSFAAPVHENTTVELVEAAAGGLRVVTDQRTWLAHNVIVATGTENRAYVPEAASGIDPRCARTARPAEQDRTRRGDGAHQHDGEERAQRARAWRPGRRGRPVPGTPLPPEHQRRKTATGTATSCGGWSGPESWARPSIRCTTRGRPAGRRPCSYPAALTTRSAWMPWRHAGCG